MLSFADFDAGTVLMQARTVLPLTSISQAPQLPPRQPVGMLMPAPLAATNQSSPMVSWVVRPLGQRRSEETASFIALRCLVGITQITQGVPQLR